MTLAIVVEDLVRQTKRYRKKSAGKSNTRINHRTKKITKKIEEKIEKMRGTCSDALPGHCFFFFSTGTGKRIKKISLLAAALCPYLYTCIYIYICIFPRHYIHVSSVLYFMYSYIASGASGSLRFLVVVKELWSSRKAAVK